MPPWHTMLTVSDAVCMEGHGRRGACRPVAFTRQAADIKSSCSVISIIQDEGKTPYRVIAELPNSSPAERMC